MFSAYKFALPVQVLIVVVLFTALAHYAILDLSGKNIIKHSDVPCGYIGASLSEASNVQLKVVCPSVEENQLYFVRPTVENGMFDVILQRKSISSCNINYNDDITSCSFVEN